MVAGPSEAVTGRGGSDSHWSYGGQRGEDRNERRTNWWEVPGGRQKRERAAQDRQTSRDGGGVGVAEWDSAPSTPAHTIEDSEEEQEARRNFLLALKSSQDAQMPDDEGDNVVRGKGKGAEDALATLQEEKKR